MCEREKSDFISDNKDISYDLLVTAPHVPNRADAYGIRFRQPNDPPTLERTKHIKKQKSLPSVKRGEKVDRAIHCSPLSVI